MTTNKPSLPHEQNAARPATETRGLDWQARHSRALQHPRTHFERALVELLRGWERYAHAHQLAYASSVQEDGVLGVAWSQIGEGLLGLLNGELNRLDGGTLDRAIRDLLTPPDAPDLTAATNAVKETHHAQAMLSPASPLEHAIVDMLRGWQHYFSVLRCDATTRILDNPDAHALHRNWSEMGTRFLGLVQGRSLDRLDPQALEERIRRLPSQPLIEEFIPDEDAFEDWEPSGDSGDHYPDYLYSYSRAQALEDGVLVDVTATAHEAGFWLPVAVTQALWADIHAIPERLQGMADPQGRLWDVLFVGRVAVSCQPPAQSSCCYELEMPVSEATRYTVKICCGPGDTGEPVLTLMQPSED